MPSKKEKLKLQKLMKDLEEANKDPNFRKAAAEFYKYHTGKTLKLKAIA